MLNSNMTVRELALEMPHATRVLEQMKIDYCCGGDRPLSEACRVAGVNLSHLESMIADATTTETDDLVDFQRLSLTELIIHILNKHHAFTKAEMARLNTLCAKVVGAHGANHPELHTVSALLRDLCADLAPHMFKEEQILFPFIATLENAIKQGQHRPSAPFGTVNNPIAMMMREHDTAGDLLRELRAVTGDYATPPDACVSYQTFYQALEGFEKDLHQHIHLENNIVFPKAAALEES